MIMKKANIIPILFMSLTIAAPAESAEQSASKPPKPTNIMQKVLDHHAKLGAKPIETLTPEQARQQPTPADAVKALLKEQGKSTEPEPVASVKDITIPVQGGQPIPARVYTPQGQGPFPAILYIHGGGWVIADLDTYDASPRALANAAKAVVVSTHYRQAPEHKFPAAHQDTFAAYQWLHQNAAQLQADPTKIAIVGESAGGNMAVGSSLMAREKNIPLPTHQVLVYPVANNDFNTPSYQENANAKPLNRAGMMWFAKHAFQSPQDGENPLISLVDKASLHGLPPTTIITAQIDPLRSEGQMLAEKLKQSDVEVRSKNFEGVTHEFFGMGAVLNEAKEAVAFAAEGLKDSFQSGKGAGAVGSSPSIEKNDANKAPQ
jgi:acetyl esterase